jgi:hypothetical protein
MNNMDDGNGMNMREEDADAVAEAPLPPIPTLPPLPPLTPLTSTITTGVDEEGINAPNAGAITLGDILVPFFHPWDPPLPSLDATKAEEEATQEPHPKKKGKRSEWTDKKIALSEEGIVILNFRDPSNQFAHEANCCVQCIPCRDSKGKSEGVVQLRRPFDTEKWE